LEQNFAPSNETLAGDRFEESTGGPEDEHVVTGRRKGKSVDGRHSPDIDAQVGRSKPQGHTIREQCNSSPQDWGYHWHMRRKSTGPW
jgi:hypothetical protein